MEHSSLIVLQGLNVNSIEVKDGDLGQTLKVDIFFHIMVMH